MNGIKKKHETYFDQSPIPSEVAPPYFYHAYSSSSPTARRKPHTLFWNL
jgi:hypothetical protein